MEQNQNYGQIQQQETAPYAVVTLVMGILSILAGCVIAGLVFGILGLVFGKKGLAACNTEPSRFKGKGMLSAGHIMSIIGTILGGIAIVVTIITYAAGAAYFSWLFDLLSLDF